MKKFIDDGYNLKCPCGEEFTYNDWISKGNEEEPSRCPACGVSHKKIGIETF